VLKKLTAIALSLGLAFGPVAANAADKKSPYWQCVTFARSITGMNIFGDAWTWWEKASGKYEKGNTPQSGAVLVFRPAGKMSRGHVAVVSQVVTERIIQITHANWSPIGGRRGQVEKDVTVVDVSDKGDWSKVKVWYGPLKDLGTTAYPTYGFIYQAAQKGQEAGQAVGQSLANQVLASQTSDKKYEKKAEKVAMLASQTETDEALSEALLSQSAIVREAPRLKGPQE
jgi:surface antigen